MRTNSKFILMFFILAVLIFVWINLALAQEAEYTVSFYTAGLEIDSKTVQGNQTMELPDPPEREGYIFAGWYTSESEGQYNAFDPTQEINSDLNLYAQWIAEDHVNIIESTSADKTVELGYSDSSGIEIRSMEDNSIVEAEELEAGVLDYPVYKDLNKNGKLDPYEDWRLSVDQRTADYVTVETKTLPVGQLGSEYSAKIRTKEPANLELVDGNLPAGLEFENGVLAGTPVEKTDKYGEQLKLRAAAAGKLDRVFRITLVVNETGPVNLADPNELSILINLAQVENAGNYTDQEWDELNEALRNAKAVYENAAELEQIDLDRAAERLEKIIK